MRLLFIILSLTIVYAEERIPVRYGEPTILKGGDWLGSIHLNAQVIFNASLTVDGVETASCQEVISCWLNSPPAWNKKNYTVTITAEDINHTDDVYFIMSYKWYNTQSIWISVVMIVGMIFVASIAVIVISFILAKIPRYLYRKPKMVNVKPKNYQSMDNMV